MTAPRGVHYWPPPGPFDPPDPGGGPALMPVLTFRPRTAVRLEPELTRTSPVVALALTSVFTFRSCAIVWLCWFIMAPAFTFVLTFSPRAIVWLWLCS